MIDEGFWKGRRVFITGHTGFKGSWLALWLQHLGAEVFGYALAPPGPKSLYDIADVGKGMSSVICDVRDQDTLLQSLVEAEPSVVLHLAAQSLVRASYEDPVETFSVNVMGTAALLEAVRAIPSVEATVCITSDKCYANQEWPWPYRESDTLGGKDPYSSSKACAELVVAAYRSSFFGHGVAAGHHSGVATARAGNVIGGGDYASDRIVPDVLDALSRGTSPTLRHPHAVRPWQHVLDPLSGYLVLAQHLVGSAASQFAQAWNFGPSAESETTVEELVRLLAQAWGADSLWERDARTQPHEAGLLKLDSSAARDLLGWRPRWSLGHAVSATVAWHRASLDGADMREFTLSQIGAYTAGR